MGVETQNVIRLFGDVWITNTVTSSWVMMTVIVIVAIIMVRRHPATLYMIIEFLTDMIADVMGEEAAITYFPFLGAMAIYVAVANSFGIVPGVIAPTRDLNTPLALAIVVFFAVHYYGIKQKGVVQYLKDTFSPIYLIILILPLEIIGQISRTFSLAMRLFGNILSGELVVAVVISLIPIIVPLPLVGLSMFTGMLQAYIFAVLATVYISTGVQETSD